MEQNFLVDQFFKGGPMMWPMLLCSLIALGVIIDRLYNLMRVPGEEEAEQQLNAAEDVLKSQGEGGAVEQFRQGSGVLNFIFAALVKRYDTLVLENRTDLEDMRQELILATEEAGELYLGRLLNALGTIGVLSPLMGLLGTIMHCNIFIRPGGWHSVLLSMGTTLPTASISNGFFVACRGWVSFSDEWFRLI